MRPKLISLVLAVVLALWGLANAPEVRAVIAPAPEHFLCDGDPLIAQVYPGAVDAPEIPNRAGDTVPGAFIVLRWRGVSLQLPRTNNTGSPSYSDGRWWWQASDPDHPAFAQRRGEWERYACERRA